MSLVTTGSVVADAFSRDRTYGRSWWGDLAELLIYDRPLSDGERAAVEAYLAAKYSLYTPTVPAPVFDPNGSVSMASTRVTVTSPIPEAEVYYTMDGSEPTQASTLYTEPLFLTARTTIRARAFRDGWNPSPIATATFLDSVTPAPLGIAGLKLWVRADAGITTSGGAVSAWADQSGNGNHLSQATAAAQPQFVTGEANGLPLVRFDGTSDTLPFTARLTTIRTVFWVVRANPSANASYRFLLGDSSKYDFHSGGTSKIWDSGYASASIRSGETRVNGAVVNGTTTDRPTTWSVISLTTTGDVAADAFSRERGTVGRSWWGDLAELVIYDRPLSDVERASVEGYLAAKYALYVPTVAAPSVTPPGGRLLQAQEVSMDCATAGATIRYTTDDTEPTEASAEYTEPFTITEATPIRAKAFRTGWNPSSVTVVTFFGEEEFTPASVPNLSLWVRGDAGHGPGEVVSWLDQGPASDSLTQEKPSARPKVVVDEASRLPVLRFDGVDDSLFFRSRLASIRTVFWVVRADALANASYRFLLGDSTSSDFHSGSSSKIFDGNANAAVRNGETRLNGAIINGTTTDRPTSLSVISLVTTGNVAAGGFSQDRSSVGRSWWGDLAELVIYDRALTPTEVRSVAEYLAGRYDVVLAP
jgi:hypothetical protein